MHIERMKSMCLWTSRIKSAVFAPKVTHLGIPHFMQQRDTADADSHTEWGGV